MSDLTYLLSGGQDVGTVTGSTGIASDGSTMLLQPATGTIPDATTTTDVTGTGGGGGITTTAPSGGGTTYKPFDAAASANTQGSIDAIPGILAAALAAEATKYQNAQNDFSSQQTTQQGQYDKSTTTNQQNYDSNLMASVRAGVRGLAGLMALLRGTGVEGQARNIVGDQTNSDIRGGLDTRNENQTQLDTTLSTFLSDLERKRREAVDTHANNDRAAHLSADTQLQDLYGKMAGYYGDSGNTAGYNDWMGRAGALTPAIAANATNQVSPYGDTQVAVKAPQITAYANPTDPKVTASDATGQIGSGIFTIGDRRRRDQSLVGA